MLVNFLIALPIKKLNEVNTSNYALKEYIFSYSQNLLNESMSFLFCDIDQINDSMLLNDYDFLKEELTTYEFDKQEVIFKKNSLDIPYSLLSIESIVTINPEVFLNNKNVSNDLINQIKYKLSRFKFNIPNNKNLIGLNIIRLIYNFNFFLKDDNKYLKNDHFRELFSVAYLCNAVIVENHRQKEYLNTFLIQYFSMSLENKVFIYPSRNISESNSLNQNYRLNISENKLCLFSSEGFNLNNNIQKFFDFFVRYISDNKYSDLLLIIYFNEKDNSIEFNNIFSFLNYKEEVCTSLSNLNNNHSILFLNNNEFIKFKKDYKLEIDYFLNLRKANLRNYLSPLIEDTLFKTNDFDSRSTIINTNDIPNQLNEISDLYIFTNLVSSSYNFKNFANFEKYLKERKSSFRINKSTSNYFLRLQKKKSWDIRNLYNYLKITQVNVLENPIINKQPLRLRFYYDKYKKFIPFRRELIKIKPILSFYLFLKKNMIQMILASRENKFKKQNKLGIDYLLNQRKANLNNYLSPFIDDNSFLTNNFYNKSTKINSNYIANTSNELSDLDIFTDLISSSYEFEKNLEKFENYLKQRTIKYKLDKSLENKFFRLQKKKSLHIKNLYNYLKNDEVNDKQTLNKIKKPRRLRFYYDTYKKFIPFRRELIKIKPIVTLYIYMKKILILMIRNNKN